VHLDPVILSLVFIATLTLGNLRGIRESGRLFAGRPTCFIVSILAMIAVGAWRYVSGTLQAVPEGEHALLQERRCCRCSCS
jgi:amino acid transporter